MYEIATIRPRGSLLLSVSDLAISHEFRRIPATSILRPCGFLLPGKLNFKKLTAGEQAP